MTDRSSSQAGREGGPPTEDRWRWAEALAIEKQHGSCAAVFVAERIGALALAGDVAGVARMKQIAARLERLIAGGRQVS